MDKPEEQSTAAAIEEALPGSSVTVEDMATPDGEEAQVAIVEKDEPPKDELEVGYRYGQLEARMKALEDRHDVLLSQLAAFELATIQAVEEEAVAIEEQREVLADVAEEVLPPDHEAANVVNPDHERKNPRVWERLFGGHHGG